MADHRIQPERRTLHGHFSGDLPPVLTIASGDRVHFTTLDAGWGLVESPGPFQAPPKFEPRDPRLDEGHALCGPVAIEGAGVGSTLAVHIEEVRPAAWGRTVAGGFPSPLNRSLGVADLPARVAYWQVDADRRVACDASGRRVTLRPFMGVLGVAPAAPGIHSTVPPRATGGNIDCRELVAGSVLYLPVAVDGARFSVGDGHGAQGDGEVSGLALECPMERVTLRFEVESRRLDLPRAVTPAGWVAFGFHEDLDQAAIAALDNLLRWMEDALGMERREALTMASLTADLRITQMVNDVQGVHALLPNDALPR